MSSKRLIAAKASCLEPCEPNFAKRHHEVSPPVQSVTSPQLCNSAQSPNVHAQLFLKQHVLSTFAATIPELKLESQPHHLGQLCANDAHLVKPKLMVPAAAQSDLQRSVAVSPVECSASQPASSFWQMIQLHQWSPKSHVQAKVQGWEHLPLIPKRIIKHHQSS